MATVKSTDVDAAASSRASGTSHEAKESGFEKDTTVPHHDSEDGSLDKWHECLTPLKMEIHKSTDVITLQHSKCGTLLKAVDYSARKTILKHQSLPDMPYKLDAYENVQHRLDRLHEHTHWIDERFSHMKSHNLTSCKVGSVIDARPPKPTVHKAAEMPSDVRCFSRSDCVTMIFRNGSTSVWPYGKQGLYLQNKADGQALVFRPDADEIRFRAPLHVDLSQPEYAPPLPESRSSTDYHDRINLVQSNFSFGDYNSGFQAGAIFGPTSVSFSSDQGNSDSQSNELPERNYAIPSDWGTVNQVATEDLDIVGRSILALLSDIERYKRRQPAASEVKDSSTG